MEEGKEGGCQLDPTAFVGLMKDELDICGKARTLLEAEAGSEGNPPYPDGPQEGKWNFEKAAGRAAVTVVVIGGTAVVVCGSMGASTPVIAGAAVTAGMAGGGMMVSDAIQGKVSSLEDYALSVASAELMFFTNQAMTRLITVTGMGFVSGTVAKAAGGAAAGAALDYLVAGEVDYERLARNLVINVVVDLGTGVLTGEAWEKPRQRTIEGGSGAGNNTTNINPKDIRFSQSSVNGSEEIIESMKKNGWKGDPIDVVQMPDGVYTTIDNTRVVSAREAGINVQANVHGYNDPLLTEYIERFTTKKGIPTTWGEAVELRVGKQKASFRNGNPYGAFNMEDIK